MKGNIARRLNTNLRLVFKNWGRKGYSLFQVISKIIIIAFLPVSYHLTADTNEPTIIIDTTITSLEYELDEIEVNSQRVPVTLSQVARIVIVIERNEIEAAPVESIQELLEYIQSVDIRQRGGQGVQADISIRGSSFDQVMILLNGVDVTDPQTGHHNLNLPVNLSQIERIEIIEGSASRVFGPNAFAGAINFITREPSENQISLYSSVGQHGYFDGSLSGSINTGKIGQYFSAGRKSSEGYIPNTDFETYNLYYRLDAGKSRNLIYQLGFTEKSFGANSFYTPKFPDQYEHTESLFSSLKWKSNSSFHFTPTVYWRSHFDRFELFRRESPEWYSTHNYHLTNVFGVNLNGWIQTELGKTAFGTNIRSEHILSNVLGNELDAPVKIKGENAQYTKSDSRNIYSVFLEHNLYFKKWSFSIGLMSNHISVLKKGVNIFPGADVSYNLASKIKIYVSVNKSLRMPTFTDLYYNGPTNVGNPDLKPETSRSVEGGIKFNSVNFQGHATYFYRDGKNIIDWVRLENENIWQTENLTWLISSGIEFSFDIYPGKKQGNSLFIKHLSAGYMFNHLKKNSNEYISRYVLDNLKHKLDFSVTHKIVNNVSANWKLIFQERNGSYTEFTNGIYGSEVSYKPFALFDMKVNYKFRHINLFVITSNIFNTKYFDFGNIIQPGRWIKTGINLDINYK
ncbi:MAG: TonB-dependent receptor [Mariniphaga sp.]|nr:TonB-dependent receptor [Mariniphaga sp.]